MQLLIPLDSSADCHVSKTGKKDCEAVVLDIRSVLKEVTDIGPQGEDDEDEQSAANDNHISGSGRMTKGLCRQ